jgi:DNA end-binding protein Ku
MGSATISFGLVSIPVKLFSTGQASESISFRMLHKKCGTPVKQQYICPQEGVTVERDDIVKGYEFSKDQYVLFAPDEIKAVEEPPTQSIALTEFVPIDVVDPIYYDRPYYLGPDKGAERAYRLLSEAMKKTGVVGLAQYAARGKQYLVMLRPVENGLVMQQLRYASEVRPFSEVPIPEKGAIKPEELKLALQLMEQTMSKEFHPENYHDTVRDRMLEAIQQKVEGQEISISPAEPAKAQIIDLMDALKASLGTTPAKGARKAAPLEVVERKPAKRSPRAAAESERAARPRKKASK